MLSIILRESRSSQINPLVWPGKVMSTYKTTRMFFFLTGTFLTFRHTFQLLSKLLWITATRQDKLNKIYPRRRQKKYLSCLMANFTSALRIYESINMIKHYAFTWEVLRNCRELDSLLSLLLNADREISDEINRNPRWTLVKV
jgi:hypothetical protein